MTPNTVLWIYIVFLLAGGLMGFIKAGSKASLIASTLFAVPLILCTSEVHVLTITFLADIILGVLLVYFTMKFAKGKKFMPGGLMALLSAVALVLRLVVLK